MNANNRYFDIYKQQSQILGRRGGSAMSEVIQEGNPSNLRSHLIRLKGSDTHPGKFYYPGGNKWISCTLENLKEQGEKLQKEWQDHVEARVNIGERAPQKWPPHLLDKQERLAARKQIALEEIRYLEQSLEKAEESKRTRERKPVHPKFWGGGSLRGGILNEFCGWEVKPDQEGLLRISDPSSPYDTMEIWRLKSEVINPMHHEYRLRQRAEIKAAKAQNRAKKSVRFPEPPTWNKGSDLVEYQGYSNEVIRKLKKEN